MFVQAEEQQCQLQQEYTIVSPCFRVSIPTRGKIMSELEFLKSIPAFSKFSTEVLKKIIENMHPGEVSATEMIFSEGDISRQLYIIRTGEVIVIKKLSEGVEKVLSVVSAGTILGEMSLFTDKPRTATAKAKTDVKYYSIDCNTLMKIFDLDSSGTRYFLTTLLLFTLERLEHTSRELATVYETTKIITKNLVLQDFCNEILKLLCYSIPDIDTGAIFVWNEFIEEYEPISIIGNIYRTNLTKDNKLLTTLYGKAETIVQEKIFNLPQVLLAPLIKEQLVGFILLGNSKETIIHSQHTIDLLNSVAYQVAGAIENIKAEQEKIAKERFDRTRDKTIRW